MAGLDWIGQQDFSAGAFPLQERTPASAVEDCVNGLFDDDGSIYKRGGGAYKGTAFASSIVSVWDVVLGGGQRTLVLTTDAGYQLGSDDATPATIISTGAYSGMRPRRIAVLGGIAAIPVTTGTSNQTILFGGSRKTAGTGYVTGTVAVTKGSTAVTGTGTSWVANVDAGTILYTTQNVIGVVKSVSSNTGLVLASPWVGDTASGLSYAATQIQTVNPAPIASTGRQPYVAVAGQRLLMAIDSIVVFSNAMNPYQFDATDYHDVGGGASISGVQGVGTSALVFSNEGISQINNLSYDLTDALGNVQQTLSDDGHDVILWNNNGIVGVDGGVLIPAIDDLYVYSGSGIQRFHAPGMRKQWRQYVKAGYTLGNAAMHRGHYLLPILDSTGTTLEDALVVRLDTGAWSRLSGHSAGVSFAQRGATTSAAPKLLAAKGTRLLDLTGCFEPAAANKNDADGTTPQWQTTLRTVQRHTSKDLLKKFRVRAELDDAASDNPTITAELAVGRPGSSFTSVSGSLVENDGQSPYTWTGVNARAQEFRVRLTSNNASSKLVLRSVEYAFRQAGRQ